VTRQGRCVGVITASDILNYEQEHGVESAAAPHQGVAGYFNDETQRWETVQSSALAFEELEDVAVEEIMSHDIVSVAPATPLTEVARKMVADGIAAVLAYARAAGVPLAIEQDGGLGQRRDREIEADQNSYSPSLKAPSVMPWLSVCRGVSIGSLSAFFELQLDRDPMNASSGVVIQKKVDRIVLGPSAPYLWREMRKKRYQPMAPARASYVLLPYLRLSDNERVAVAAAEAAEGAPPQPLCSAGAN
jgi:hypothetical protein